jgi:small subunit ribosomal protein S10
VRFWNPRFVVSSHVEREVRIRLEGGDCGVLDTTACRLTSELQSAGGTVHGPFPLPSRHERYTALSAGGRTVYSIITHKRLLSVVNARQEVIARLGSTTLPPELSVRLAEYTRVVPHT